MERLKIALAASGDLTRCVDILMDSILGERYFTRETAKRILREGIRNREVYLGRLPDGAILGFFKVVEEGSFLVFPYLNLLVVESGHRGMGYGSRLLSEAERLMAKGFGYPFPAKLFLLVGGANRRARSFYRKNGYRPVGAIENMFAEGDTEILMVKVIGS